MGITGLLPFLKKSSKNTNLRHYSGCTAAVDGFGWLHKGAFGCAVKLGMGEATDVYVTYFMKYVNVLREHNIKPLVVFDGRSLPAKAEVNKKRRELRAASKKMAQELVRKGDNKSAWEYFVKAVEITHEMVLNVIKVLRQQHIDYIVAPYEADAQLAYLARSEIVDFVVTEDSDLVPFGCPKIMFKLNTNGDCVLFTQEKVHLCMEVPAKAFQFDRFRHMCILSGCDYLSSLPKIGLTRAKKIVNAMTPDIDIYEAIRRIPNTLKLDIEVPEEYIKNFMEADNSFLYQLVFDPKDRQIKPLNPYPEGVNRDQFYYAGTYDLTHEEFFQLALGNMHTKTLVKVDSYDIDKDKGYSTSSSSIWSRKTSSNAATNSAILAVSCTVRKKRQLASNENNVTDITSVELNGIYSEVVDKSTSPSKSWPQKRSKRMSMMMQDTSELVTSKNPFGDSCSDDEQRGQEDVTDDLGGMTLRKRSKTPFLKSPDIGMRARAKILDGSNASQRLPNVSASLTEEFSENLPFCVVEKNRIYDTDKNLIVKSRYFRKISSHVSSDVGSESNKDFTQVCLNGSQLSIYCIDKEDVLDSQQSFVNSTPSETISEESDAAKETCSDVVESVVVDLEGEYSDEITSSSYFNEFGTTTRSVRVASRNCKTTPVRAKPKMSCRSQGLKKPVKKDSKQQTLLQMFAFQTKSKI